MLEKEAKGTHEFCWNNWQNLVQDNRISPFCNESGIKEKGSRRNVYKFLSGSRNRKMVNRRRISGTPRVPFSTEQLMKLEKSYEETQYVSSAQVTQLSAMLKLPEHRIKIWFQNRRAREKKRAKNKTERIAPSKTIDKVVANDKPQDRVPYPAHVNSFEQCSGRKDKFSTHFAFHHFNRTNMNNKEWCARLTLPPIHIFNHFDYNIYSGLTIHV